MSLEILHDELQLVEERLTQNHVLRPYVCLIVRERSVQLEMLRHAHVLILARYLDEAGWILVSFGTKAPLLLGPVANAIGADRACNLIAKRLHGDHGKAADFARAGNFLNCRDEL